MLPADSIFTLLSIKATEIPPIAWAIAVIEKEMTRMKQDLVYNDPKRITLP